MGVGVGVAVGVGNGLGGVGEPVGDGGLLTTMRRGEITPHDAIRARRPSTQTTIQLRFGFEWDSIVKEMPGCEELLLPEDEGSTTPG